MKLLELALENVRGAPDGTYAFANPATGKPFDLVLVTGPGASGKSSFVEAIAAVKELVGGYGPPPDVTRLRRRGAAIGRIAATWLLSEEEAARSRGGPVCVTEVALNSAPPKLFEPGVRAVFSAYSPEPTQPKMELFPAGRRLPTGPGGNRSIPPELSAGRHRLSRDPNKYGGARQALFDLAAGDASVLAERLAARGVLARWEQADSLGPIRQGLASLSPRLRLVGVQPGADGGRVVFRRAGGADLELADLSESELSALLFAIVFDRVGLRGSIVLIDEPEAHLHPDEQVGFLRGVAALGAGNQLIAATSSEALLASVPVQQVIDLAATGRERQG